MFGYIRIDKPELKLREYEAYRAVYCGLCRSMGKCTGCSSRMTLSYDFAFLLLFRMILTETKPEFIFARCPAHPMKKRMMLETNAESEYVSCAAAILLFYKCKDDLADERGKKRFLARTLLPSARRMRKRALKRLPALHALDEAVAGSMARIADAERTGEPSIDLYASLSGEMLSEIFSFGLDTEKKRIAQSVGRHTGKWIYLLDAYDDLDEDRRLGRFNPYLTVWGSERDEGSEEKRRETVRIALLSELRDAENAIDLMDLDSYGDFSGVLRNILYLGMPKTAESVLKGEKTRGKRKNVPDGKEKRT